MKSMQAWQSLAYITGFKLFQTNGALSMIRWQLLLGIVDCRCRKGGNLPCGSTTILILRPIPVPGQ
jgi:hypothetical protein